MTNLIQPFHSLVIALAGWLNRQQQAEKAIAGIVSFGYRIPELRVSAKSCSTRSLAKAIEPEFVCQSIAILA